MQDLPCNKGAGHVVVEAHEVPAIEVARTEEVPVVEAERTQAKTPSAKKEAEEDESLGGHLVKAAMVTCNTRFIRGHKPSNHIRARIKSHAYTTE